MKIALYSGSFNPIHYGHLAVARAALEAGADEVWMVVTPQNPLKRATDLLPETDRLAMVQLATQDTPRIKASDCEFHLPRPSYTIDTLRHLSSRHPEHRFTLLIGEDNLRLFDRWKEHTILLEEYGLMVYPRSGDNKGIPASHPNITIIEAPLIQISSTGIRQRLRDGLPVDHLTPPAVVGYLAKSVRLS